MKPKILDEFLHWALGEKLYVKLQRFGKIQPQPQPFFTDAVLEIDAFGKFARSQVCPYCKKKDGFTIGKFERGNDGWEFTVECAHCHVTGVVNTTGFRFEK